MRLRIEFVLLCIFLFQTVLQAQTVDRTDKSYFINPPKQFYPMPFWHINGEMTNEGIRQLLEDHVLYLQ